MGEDDFYLKIAHALSGCQLIEQELKLYITQALELVKKCVSDKLPFAMSGEDYADKSLERLIAAFKKLTSNSELVRDLTAFKDERNFLSHRGIARSLDPDGGLYDSATQEVLKRAAAIQSEAERLRAAINEEANKFRGYLLFKDLTKGS
jgi:hypothetical protein